jgi:hypothetical protein
MNTCLSVVYLKLHQIDSRYIRLALTIALLFVGGGSIMGLPINGDVGI